MVKKMTKENFESVTRVSPLLLFGSSFERKRWREEDLKLIASSFLLPPFTSFLLLQRYNTLLSQGHTESNSTDLAQLKTVIRLFGQFQEWA